MSMKKNHVLGYANEYNKSVVPNRRKSRAYMANRARKMGSEFKTKRCRESNLSTKIMAYDEFFCDYVQHKSFKEHRNRMKRWFMPKTKYLSEAEIDL